jgi:hypothetical protein
VRDVASVTAPFSTGGVSANFLGEVSKEQVKAAYGSHYQRLVALRRQYGPTNFFYHNQHIEPTA